MRLFVVEPDNHSAPAPAIIVLQEAFGVNKHIQEVTSRIAALGYLAVAPELFHRTAPGFEGDYQDLSESMPHIQALTNVRIEEDLQSVYHWLKTNELANSETMAAIGFCLGGKAAFIANAVLPLKAAISFYGSGIPLLLEAYAQKQQAPLLLFWGGKDKHIDAEKRAAIRNTLHEAEKSFTHVEFSEAGHGFFCEERVAYDAHAAHESWAMLAVFLKNYLEV